MPTGVYKRINRTKEGERICTRCKKSILLDVKHFPPVKTKGFNGFAYTCWKCQKKLDRINWPNYYLRNRERLLKYQKKHNEDNPLKRKARNILTQAIMSGKVIRKPCEKCGNAKSHGHHPDYYKPLYVVWLCAKHHGIEHRRLLNLIEEQ